MHIIALLFALVGGIAFWAWRLKALRDAARDTSDVAQTVINAPRRIAFRYKTGKGGLDVIEDPREAAAVMMVAVAKAPSATVTARQETVIEAEISRLFELGAAETSDLFDHAVWVNNTSPDSTALMHKLSQILVSSPQLGPKDIIDFDAMLVAVSEAEGLPKREQLALMQVFRDKAGLKT
jgi:hypothetical protein